MKITKFAVGAPDSDGDMNSSIEFVAVNPTKEDVRLVRYHAVVTDKDGYAVACNIENEESCNLEPGGDLTLGPWITLQKGFCGKTRDNLKLTMSATMYAREFTKLGEIEVPAKDLTVALVEKKVSSSVIDGTVKVGVQRKKEDDSGQVQVSCMVMVRNKSDLHLQKVQLKSELLDSEDAVVESNESDVTIAAHCVSCIDGGFSWLKKSQLKGAKVRMGLFVFRPVYAGECTAVSTPEDESGDDE